MGVIFYPIIYEVGFDDSNISHNIQTALKIDQKYQYTFGETTIKNEKNQQFDRVFFSYSHDYGKSFSEPQDISLSENTWTGETKMILMDDHVILVWREEISLQHTLAFATSDDHGKNLDKKYLWFGSRPDIVHHNEILYLTWVDLETRQVFYVTSDNRGVTFSEPTSVFETNKKFSPYATKPEPKFVIDENIVKIVWESQSKDYQFKIGQDSLESKRTPPPEPPFEKKEPQTKIEIMFGDKLSNQLIPVIFTEITTDAEVLDEITVWNFELIGHSGDDRYVAWNVLAKDKRIGYEITDGNTGLDVINYDKMPEAYALPADQHIYRMDCGMFQTVEGESAHPTSFPINNGTSSIFAKNSRIGIFPNDVGEYSFEFASIFQHSVKFSDEANDFVDVISLETKECHAKWQIDGDSNMESGNGYYTKMTFRFLEHEN